MGASRVSVMLGYTSCEFQCCLLAQALFAHESFGVNRTLTHRDLNNNLSIKRVYADLWGWSLTWASMSLRYL